MTYEEVKFYSAMFSLFLFISLFTIVVIWAFRPGSQKEMDDHARIPLKED